MGTHHTGIKRKSSQQQNTSRFGAMCFAALLLKAPFPMGRGLGDGCSPTRMQGLHPTDTLNTPVDSPHKARYDCSTPRPFSRGIVCLIGTRRYDKCTEQWPNST